jgi:hypothetical protein
MTLKLVAMLAVALCLTTAPARAAEPRDSVATGNDLLNACGSAKPLEYGMCMGYISGLVDGFLVADRTIICVPAGLTRGQLRDVVVAGIQSLPKERGQVAYAVALLALAKTFPCQKRRASVAK